jgi:hypothetical protein
MAPVASANQKFVLNLSDHVFKRAEEMVLQNGLNIGEAVEHSNLDMACAAESVAYKLPPVVGMEFKWKIRTMLEKTKPLISNISRAESNALKSLKRNRDIRILPGDKGNCTVVMNETTYMEKLNTLLDSGVYETLPKDSTSRIERKNSETFIQAQIRAFCRIKTPPNPISQ